MAISPLAGKPAAKEMLVDLARLEREYYARTPDMEDPNQSVVFGTSGHRGPGPPGPKTSTRSMQRRFKNEGHLEALVSEAQEMVNHALGSDR